MDRSFVHLTEEHSPVEMQIANFEWNKLPWNDYHFEPTKTSIVWFGKSLTIILWFVAYNCADMTFAGQTHIAFFLSRNIFKSPRINSIWQHRYLNWKFTISRFVAVSINESNYEWIERVICHRNHICFDIRKFFVVNTMVMMVAFFLLNSKKSSCFSSIKRHLNESTHDRNELRNCIQ